MHHGYLVPTAKLTTLSDTEAEAYKRLPDTSATRHFGTKTLRTRMRHFSMHRLKTLLHRKRGTRHFGIRSTKSRDTLHQGQFRQDTAPPVIRLKVGAEVSWCRNVLWPKCPAPLRTISLDTWWWKSMLHHSGVSGPRKKSGKTMQVSTCSLLELRCGS